MDDAQGVGLAATQLGVLQRVFVFDLEEEGRRRRRQPALSTLDDDRGDRGGGLPLARGVRVPVERSTKVGARGQDPNGDEVSFELEGLAARVVQHETDHLDGVLIIDRTDTERRKEALGRSGRRPTSRRVRLAVAATASVRRRRARAPRGAARDRLPR